MAVIIRHFKLALDLAYGLHFRTPTTSTSNKEVVGGATFTKRYRKTGPQPDCEQTLSRINLRIGPAAGRGGGGGMGEDCCEPFLQSGPKTLHKSHYTLRFRAF
jgi:hypothetical protein